VSQPGLVVVTASSSNHFGPLQLMLASLRDLNARVICYDIGLSAREVARLYRWPGLELRRFPFESYPPHVDVQVNAGHYAWKPIVVAEVVDEERRREHPDDVLWSDAGAYFYSLDQVAARLRESGGLYVRRSSGDVAKWTHPAMFRHFADDPARYADRPNASADLVGFAIGSAGPAEAARVYEQIVQPWREAALVKECIAPAGSSRRNHRQDQAVLTYLIHRAGYAFARHSWRELGMSCKCDRFFYHYGGFRVPRRLYALLCSA
jgi:hypothetical protein